MMNIALVGGIGSGKSTFAKALQLVEPQYHRVHMGLYNVMIPLSLIATSCPELLSLGKADYIEKVLDSEGIDLVHFYRNDLDQYLGVITRKWETVAAEMGYAACHHNSPNVLDGVPRIANVRYLKNMGFAVIGFDCSPETRLKRRYRDERPMDLMSREDLEQQMRFNDVLYQLGGPGNGGILSLADIIIDTDATDAASYPDIAIDILERIESQTPTAVL